MVEDDPVFIASSRLRDLAEVIGVRAALTLAEVVGGQDGCHVPKVPRPDHPWAQAIGLEAFRRLCAYYGGERISVPRNAYAVTAKSRMLALKRRGLSHRAIARALGCTERWVRMTLNGRGDERQHRLFADD